MAEERSKVPIRQVVAEYYDIAPEDVTSDHLDPVVLFLRRDFPHSAPVEGGGWLMDESEVEAARQFLDAIVSDEDLGVSSPWDEFIRWGQVFHGWEGFDASERDFKIVIGQRVAAARDAVLAEADDWTTAVKQAFGGPNNLTFFITHSKYIDWMQAHPESARAGLLALWDESESLTDRVTAFSDVLPKDLLPSPSARLQIASLLLMADPIDYVIYRPTPFKLAAELVEFEPFPDGPEAAIYEHALELLDTMIEQAHDRGLILRDRLDAQGVIWAIARGEPTHLADIGPEQVEALKRYRGEAPSVWWVNQGGLWQLERENGVITAPVTSRAGHVLQHHKNVSRLRKGDIVIHYAGGAVRAISEVTGKPSLKARPWDTDGGIMRTAPVKYHDLGEPIPVQEIDHRRRIEARGPFDTAGGVKQVYLMPLGVGFSQWLRGEFRDRWPEGSPWASAHKPTWLFQANPEVWPLAKKLGEMETDEEETFTVSRYRTEIAIGDRVILWQAGTEAGAYGLGMISGPAFERGDEEESFGSGDHAVPWRLTRKLDPPILRGDLLAHPVLKGLSVLTAPQGTNFKVTPEQWEELRKLIDGEAPTGIAPRPEEAVGEIPFEDIAASIAAQGMTLSDRTLRRFHIALRTRGFVILSGVSGTGKTWLTELYASASGAVYHLEPVAPNWTTNEDLIGYHNPIDGAYRDTDVSGFLRRAAAEFAAATAEQREPRKYLLALDEMNLARVEYYFAKFLSLMEVKARRGSFDLQLGDETITIGSNLLFVGTVNVDETTHGFADKVFDRAQLIELTAPRDAIAAHIGTGDYAEALLQTYDAVAEARPFAFRVVEDIKAYIGESEGLNVQWHDALDEQVLQKVLPKLSGAEPSIGRALDAVIEVADQHGLALTRAKAERMRTDYARDGFASYF